MTLHHAPHDPAAAPAQLLPAAVHGAPADADPALRGGGARRSRPRNLVILRAGDASLHREWLANPSRDFDLFISYYGSQPDRHAADADFYETRQGPKWPCVGELLAAHRQLVDDYEAFWIPDDDLSADTATLNRMFAFFCAYRLALAQPALTIDSYHSWPQLLQRSDCDLRYVQFVEAMAPLFSREALRVCAPSFAESRSGWGLDWLWPALCDRSGLGRLAVIDATPVRHTRPISGGGDLYKNHPDMNPRDDEARILQGHGLTGVRSLGKYAGWSRVTEVPLTAPQQLALWLCRLDGRRRLARRA